MSAFYCQLDYEHVPYRSPMGTKNGNISNNGCGVCSAAMVAENLMGIPFPPEMAARLSKMCGAREVYGTDLYTYSPVFAANLGMTVYDTEDVDEMLRFLQEKRGMVIANIRGDRPDDGYIGVFSTGGHYVVLADAEGDIVKVWDPMYQEGSGRFDIPGRKEKVRMDGLDAYAHADVFREDCLERPFFLFEKRAGEKPLPLIGVLCEEDNKAQCEQALLRSGSLPLFISPDTPAESAYALFSGLNGLLLADDSAPEALKEALIRLCIEKKKPLLATGSNMALLAKSQGASLSPAPSCDAVSTLWGTRLEVVAGGEYAVSPCIPLNVETLPEALRACAQAKDGSIAALELCNGPFTLGVAWKAEAIAQSDPNAAALFAALTANARKDFAARPNP